MLLWRRANTHGRRTVRWVCRVCEPVSHCASCLCNSRSNSCRWLYPRRKPLVTSRPVRRRWNIAKYAFSSCPRFFLLGCLIIPGSRSAGINRIRGRVLIGLRPVNEILQIVGHITLLIGNGRARSIRQITKYTLPGRNRRLLSGCNWHSWRRSETRARW